MELTQQARLRVGLALSGGGARGLAHVGVIRVLEREGIPIDCLAGTSAGSVVSVAYAAGIRGDRLLQMALQIRWRQLARPVFSRRGLVSFARLESYLLDTIGDRAFADLELPCAVVAADLATGEPVILRQGRVAPAVRASCSVPGIVTPVELNGRLLIDGAVANNLPISAVRALGADRVIAVGLGVPSGEYPRNPLQAGVAAIEFLILHAAADPATADVHIPIPLWGLSSLVRTSRQQQIITLGEQAAEQALPTIRAALAHGAATRVP
jgi:NTE family protein